MAYEATFPSSASSVPAARRFVIEALNRCGSTDQERQLVELVVSELATNALRHAKTAYTVALDVEPDTVKVAVRDSGKGSVAPLASPADAPEGRGLLVVGWLAKDWGVDQHHRGKTVWALIDRMR